MPSLRKAPAGVSTPTSKIAFVGWRAKLNSLMTIKRKNQETGETESKQVKLSDIFLGTPSFRTIIILLLVSMHPVGRQLLGTFGFEFPDQRKLTVAAAEASASKHELTQIAEDMKEMKDNLAGLKTQVSSIDKKQTDLDSTFRGFQIDFNKWRPSEKKPE